MGGGKAVKYSDGEKEDYDIVKAKGYKEKLSFDGLKAL